MLGHIGIVIERTRPEEVVLWCLRALAPLGYTKQKRFGDHLLVLGKTDLPYDSEY